METTSAHAPQLSRSMLDDATPETATKPPKSLDGSVVVHVIELFSPMAKSNKVCVVVVRVANDVQIIS